MGAIDLVVQIEAPPSVASGLQRIGRVRPPHRRGQRRHHLPEVPRRPASPARRSPRAMRQGQGRAVALPAQPARRAGAADRRDGVDGALVGGRSVSHGPSAPRRSRSLSRRVFDGVLDMLSGRYPSDEFAELRPRVTWDRVNGTVTARQGAKRVAIANAGTIPDRGLYGVFLAGADKDEARVGELDEEMVFEARAGETFLLGASTWRIEQITHDRVLVSPAPGEPGKMPFWKGEGPGRPIELGMAIGKLVRELRRRTRRRRRPPAEANTGSTRSPPSNLLQYLDDQFAAAGAVPDDRTIVIERSRDDLGDWRVAVLSPFGSRVHAPWAMAVTARIRDEPGLDVEVMWCDDGFVVRYAGGRAAAGHVAAAARSRRRRAPGRAAARIDGDVRGALPRSRRPRAAAAPPPARRARAAVAAAQARRGPAGGGGALRIVPDHPRDLSRVPARHLRPAGARSTSCARVRSRAMRVVNVESQKPSPFAASLLFGYVANYIYDGDAPLAERRAQALSVDQSQLRELIGDSRAARSARRGRRSTALEHDAAAPAGAVPRALDRRRARSAAAARRSVARRRSARAPRPVVAETADRRARHRRGASCAVRVAGEERLIAVEDAARYRDALGMPLPPGLPEALLEPVADRGRRSGAALRPHARPVHAGGRRRAPRPRRPAVVEATLQRLPTTGRVIEGEFRPGGRGREWCDAEVLRSRAAALAGAAAAGSRAGRAAGARAVPGRRGMASGGRGGPRLRCSTSSSSCRACRSSRRCSNARSCRRASIDYAPVAARHADLGAGEVTWIGVEPLGERDGRIALYPHRSLPGLLPPAHGAGAEAALAGREALILAWLHAPGRLVLRPAARGGRRRLSAGDRRRAVGARVEGPGDQRHAASRCAPTASAPERARRPARATPFRSRRLIPPSAEGRWTAVAGVGARLAHGVGDGDRANSSSPATASSRAM